MSTTSPPRSRWRPWSFAVPLFGPPLALGFVRAWDPAGDRGLANVLGTGVGLLVLLVWSALFVWRGGWSWRWRLGWPLALVAASVLGGALLRVDGVQGDMIPVLRSRLGSASGSPAVSTRVSTTDAATAEPRLEPDARRDHPGFLGPARDATRPDVHLRLDWETHPPRRLWRATIGPGWSGFAVASGWAATMEQGPDGELVSLRDARTGSVAWTRTGGSRFVHPLGGDGPRATPALAGPSPSAPAGSVIVLGARGWLACLDARDGRVVWQHDLEAEHGLTPGEADVLLQYGRANSPLVVGTRVIVPVGGAGASAAGLMAFDLATGAVLWSGPPRSISYSSPVAARLGEREQVLIVNEASVSGHALEDGRLLWEHPWPGVSSGAANASPVLVMPASDEGLARVLVSKGYGAGALLLELAPRGLDEDGGFEAREVWRNPRVLRTKFTSVVRHAEHLYGLGDGILECVASADGERVWRAGRYGHGQVLLLGDTLLVTAEDGRVVALEATPDEPARERGTFQALEGKCWATPAFASGLLLLRNDVECAAWELAVEAR